MQHLLVEIADTHYARSENREAEARLHTVIMRMLVPMVKIMEVEQESMKVERQKIQEATLALLRVREECQRALVDFTQEHARSARDLEELGKALEENRLAAEEAGRKLTEKEKQIHVMLQQQQDLVVRLVCGGPTEFLKWAREEIQSQGLVDLDSELEHAWWPITRVTTRDHKDEEEEKTPMPNFAPECSTPKEQEENKTTSTNCSNNQFVYSEKPSLSTSTMTLLCVVVSETFQQMVESCGRVKGPLSLPSAIAGFWMGLAGRMTYLAMVTLLPQVTHKS